MRRCADGSNKSASAFYSPILHNVLLALGTKYSSNERVRSSTFTSDSSNLHGNEMSLAQRGTCFIDQALKHVQAEWNSPKLSTVIGCMLLGTWHQTNANSTMGWLYEGIGVRLAFTLGLHMNSFELARRGVISRELQRAREYCWATVAFQDKLWSYTLGRMPSIKMHDIQNIDPPRISARMDSLPWRSFPRQTTLPGLYSTVMYHTARLTGIAEQIHAINYSARHSTSIADREHMRTRLQ